MKKYTVKVYDGATFRGTFAALENYSFSSTINGGIGALNIKLPRKFDDFSDALVNVMDKIEIWVQDIDSNGVKVYSGYVSRISSELVKGEQQITVTALGYATQIATQVYASGDTTSMTNNSVDSSDIVRDFVDNMTDAEITYDATSVEDSGVTVSYQSDCKTGSELLERIRQMTGDWYWFVDANNKLQWHARPTTPSHYFTIGKDIAALKVEENTDDIVNTIYIWNGLQPEDTNFLRKKYSDATSITNYGLRVDKLTDSRITDETTMDSLGDAFIAANKDPNIKVELRIIDNNLGDGYDIESIQVGQTFSILNSADSRINIDTDLQITSVYYTPEYVDIIAQDKRSITGRKLTDIRRQLDQTVYSDGVGDFTT